MIRPGLVRAHVHTWRGGLFCLIAWWAYGGLCKLMVGLWWACRALLGLWAWCGLCRLMVGFVIIALPCMVCVDLGLLGYALRGLGLDAWICFK